MVNVAPETTTAPGSGDVSRGVRATWFGHPAQLARLFTTEMWERFGFYGMRALLTLYLANHFLFDDQTTTGLYGGFTALVYLTPDRKSTRLNSSHANISYAVFCLT